MTDFDHAEYARNNRHRFSQYGQDGRDKIRSEMIEEYGGKCAQCGENDPIVLVLDHINDDAHVEKELYGVNARGGHKLYTELKRQGWPKERFQLLCCNCNQRKEFYRRRSATIASNTAASAFNNDATAGRGRMRKGKNNQSGVKGVFWNSQKQKWQARILVNYIGEHLGFYNDIRDAARAYAMRAIEAWGADANVATEEEIEAAYEHSLKSDKTDKSLNDLGL